MAIDNITVFNTPPYYDDFDASKNFLRVLFNPGFPVQARELTQLQTILQNQIGSFASNIFKDGSLVVPGGVFVDEKCHYVKVETSFVRNEASFDLKNTFNDEYYQNLVGKKLNGIDSGVTGTVIDVLDEQGDDPITLYIKYESRGNTDAKTGDFSVPPSSGESPVYNTESQSTKVFVSGEYLVDAEQRNILSKVKDTNPTGYSTRVSVDDGIYYAKKSFLAVERQSIIAARYHSPYNSATEFSSPSFSVFLRLFETVVEPTDDFTLLDPSTGTPNYNSPGANRYYASLVLESDFQQTTQNDANTDTDRIEIVRYENGVLTFKKTNTSYSRLMDVLARRTYEESGDYYLRPFDVSVSDSGATPSSSTFDITISPSTAYVKGYRVEKIGAETFSVQKARTTRVENSVSVPIQYGNYFIVETIQGFPDVSTHETIQLLDNSDDVIGIARIKTFEPDLTAGRYRAYLFDIVVISGESLDSVVKLASVDPDAFSATVNSSNPNIIGSSGNNTFLFDATEKGELKTLLPGESVNTSYQVTRFIDNETLTTDGSFKVLTINIGSTSTFDDSTSWRFYVYNVNFSDGKEIDASDISLGTTTATIKFDSGEVGSNTKCVGTFYTIETPTVNSQRTLEVVEDHVCETIDTTFYGSNEFILSVGNVLRIKSVETDESPAQDLTSEFTLVRSSKENFVGNDRIRCKDITKDFGGLGLVVTVDYIDHTQSTALVSVDSYLSASIIPEEIPRHKGDSLGNYLDFRPKKGYTTTKKTDAEINNGGLDERHIIFPSSDYSANIMIGDEIVCPFFPSGSKVVDVLYSSPETVVVSSFSATTSNAETNVPCMFVSQEMTSSDNGIQVNPVTPDSFANIDYEYYQERQDLIFIDTQGSFGVVSGASADDGLSVVPETPENAMTLYRMRIPSYTYTVDSIDLYRYDNRSYTMNDIGRLEKRIEDLEEFTTLSLLEKSTADLQVFDDSGNERYKNGFVADGFTSYQIANTSHEDCAIVLKTDEGVLAPQFSKFQINYDIDISSSSGIKVHHNDVVTLDYSEQIYYNQQYASYSEFLNPFDITVFEGKVTLKPHADSWHDVDTIPRINNSEYINHFPYAPVYPGWGYPYDSEGWWNNGYGYAYNDPLSNRRIEYGTHPNYGTGYHPVRSSFRAGSLGDEEYQNYREYSWWAYPTTSGYPNGDVKKSWSNHPQYGWGWHPTRFNFRTYADWYDYRTRFPQYGYGCTDTWVALNHPEYGSGFHPPKSCFGVPDSVNENNYTTSGYQTEYENWKFYQERFPLYNGFYHTATCRSSTFQKHPNYGWGWHPEQSCYSSYNTWFAYKDYSLAKPGCYSYSYDHPDYGSGVHPSRNCFQDYNTWYYYKWYGYDAYSWYGYPYYNNYPYWNWKYYRGWYSPYWNNAYWWGEKNPGVHPWIPCREILFRAEMLKPNTKYYVMFDNRDVTAWCRQISENEYSNYEPSDDGSYYHNRGLNYYENYGIQMSSSSPRRHPRGTTELRTNNEGNLFGSLFIPFQTFISGTKGFRISDDPTHNENDETSFANANFVAEGSSLFPYHDYYSSEWYDPIAQSFTVDEPEGIFVTSIDVFFDQISDDYPVELSIQTMDNGFPTKTTINGASKILSSENLREQLFSRLEGNYDLFTDDETITLTSYQTFETWTNSLENVALVANSGGTATGKVSGTVKCVNIGDLRDARWNGKMWGSPNGNYVWNGECVGRILQHALPYQAWVDNVGNNGIILMNVAYLTGRNYSFLQKTRNGFTSSSLIDSGAVRVDSVVYWDFQENEPRVVYPFNETGPFVHTIDGQPEPDPDQRTMYIGSPYTSMAWNSLDPKEKVGIPARFTFDSPVYLEGNGSEYAIRVVTNGTEYKAFVAELGNQDISSEISIPERAAVGSFFKSQNASTWTSDEYKDLKYIIHRARFGNNGSITFKNTEQHAEILFPDSIFVEAGTNFATVFAPNHGLFENDIVYIGNVETRDAFGTSEGNDSVIDGQFTVRWSDFDRFKIEIDETGSPEMLPSQDVYIGGTNAIITKNRRIDFARIVSSSLAPENTRIESDITLLGAESHGMPSLTPYNKKTFSDVRRNEYIYFDRPYMVASYDNEDNKLSSGVKSLDVVYNLFSSSDTVSPVINTQNSYVEAYSNIVNDPSSIYTDSPLTDDWFVDDTEPKETSSLNKYITKEIELKEPASAIYVYVGANRPSSDSSMKVYYKIKEPGYEGEFDDLPWTEITPESSLLINPNRDMIDTVEYTVTENDLDNKVFSSFAIKLVLLSKNTAMPITVSDFRALAVT